MSISPALFIALIYAAVGAYGLIIGEYSFTQEKPGPRHKRQRYVIHGDKARYWAYGWLAVAVTPFLSLSLAFVALVVMAIIATPLLEQESRRASRTRRTRDAAPMPKSTGPVNKASHAFINGVDPTNASVGDMRELVRIAVKGAAAGLDPREALMAGDRQGASDIEAGYRATEILRKIGEPTLPYLLEADLGQKDFKHIFKKIGDPAVEPLLALLADERPGQRAGAAIALGTMGVPAAVEPLIGLLDDADDKVQFNAVKALGLIGDARARQPLERLKAESTTKRALNSELLRALRKLE